MKIAVTGCGWFGLPLAKALVDAGFAVIGSKRDQAGCDMLQQQGIESVAMTLPIDDAIDARMLAPLFDVDAMVINIPPGLRRGDNDYLTRLQSLKSHMLPGRLKKLIFISTTGVYPEAGVMTEDGAVAHSPSSSTLLAAEQMFIQAPELLAPGGQVSVLRFSGLVGPRRHPGRFLAGKTDIKGPAQSVNLVHLDDCVAACISLLNAKTVSQAYNLCIPEHQTKGEFYVVAALALGLEPPKFACEDPSLPVIDKQIDGSLICRELGYQYQYSRLNQILTAC